MKIAGLSGGRTSAYMGRKLIDKYGAENVMFVFANTSLEHDETYKFIRRCELDWGIHVVYLEAVVHHDKRKACTHKQVAFEDLKRDGSVFEEVIKKYGLPNKVFMHCTRELKQNVIKSWMKERGVDDLDYAIGIRVDEIDRMAVDAEKRNIIYPLISEFPSDKWDVLGFWNEQPFDLDLPEHYGNCVTCFKKSARKLLTIAMDSPESYNFMDRMERSYSSLKGEKRFFLTQARFSKYLTEGEYLTIRGLVGLAYEIDFEEFSDPYFDQHDGCSESCEAF